MCSATVPLVKFAFDKFQMSTHHLTSRWGLGGNGESGTSRENKDDQIKSNFSKYFFCKGDF